MMLGAPIEDPSEHASFYYQWTAMMISKSPAAQKWKKESFAQSSAAHEQRVRLQQLYVESLPRWRRVLGEFVFGLQYPILVGDTIHLHWRKWYNTTTRLREMFDSPV
jgi:hypothetical protein